MGLVVLYALISRYVNRMPLISPLVNGPVEVQAREPEVFISCETPKTYLECKAYQHEITWEQHNKISKIIKCESGWNPQAINTKNKNGSFDAGLVQINSIHKDISNADKFDYKKSIDWMIKKVNKEGFGAWRSSIKCHGVK